MTRIQLFFAVMAEAGNFYDIVPDAGSDSCSSSNEDEYDEVRKGFASMISLEKKLESLL